MSTVGASGSGIHIEPNDAESVSVASNGEPVTVVILIAHGSRASASNDNHRDLAMALAERSGLDVRPAFLELAEPSIPAAIDEAVADGATSLRVVPHFLGPGRHTTTDIPAAIDEATLRHPDVAFTVTAHLGSHPAIIDVVLDLIAP